MSIKFLNTVVVDAGVLKVDASSNRVGINTNNPGGELQVVGAGSIGNIYISANAAGSSVTDSLHIKKEALKASIINRDGGDLALGANNSEKVTIKTTGNVGIGTTSPSSILHLESSEPTLKIKSSGYYSNSAIEMGNGANATAGVIACNNNPGFAALELKYDNGALGDARIRVGQRYLDFRIDNANAMYINSSKNVGIGTTTPFAKLHITESTSNNYAKLRLQGSNRGGIIEMYNGSSNPVSSWTTDQSGNTYFATSGMFGGISLSNRLTILTAGNVGIGTTSPSAKLDVVQGTGANGAAALHLIGPNTNPSLTTSVLIIEQGDGKKITMDGNDIDVSSGDLFINDYSGEDVTFGGQIKVKGLGSPVGDSYISNGNFGVGTTSPGEKLEVAGSVKATASTDAYKGYIKQSIACGAAEKSASANYNLISYNTLSTTTSNQYYNRMVAAYDGRIKKVYIRDTGGNTPTASVVNIKKQVNDATSSTVYSTTVTGSGAGMSAVRDFADNDFTFSAGDSFGILYQTTDSGGGAQTMGGVAINIIIEYNIT